MLKKLILSSFFCLSILSFIPEQFRMNYTQEFKSMVAGEKRSASGVFEYQYPGKLKIDQKNPEQLIYTTNKKNTWVYRAPLFDDEPAEVTVSKGQESGLSKFFDILKNGLSSNEEYKVEKNGKEYKLSFTDKSKKITGVAIAIIYFKEKDRFEDIDHIIIKYEDGREVDLMLSSIDTKVKFAKKYFDFEIPKGAKVLKN